MKWFVIFCSVMIFAGCNPRKASVYLTTGDKLKLLQEEPQVNLNERADSRIVITIDTATRFQQIAGFGAALTGSSAYLINKKLNTTQRNVLLNDLFDSKSGIGISYLRVTMGASDFSLRDFTYDDMAEGQDDVNLKNFSIDADREDVLPVLKNILTIAPDLNIMATPWSAPSWMKTNNSLKGGELRPEFYSTYANYFVRYLKAYQEMGINIDAVTPQNEPLHHVANYPCMSMSAAQQLDFVKNHLGPAFQSERINTGIMLYDHNWDNTEYAISILNDQEAKKFVLGTAFHAYAGSVSAMSTVHDAHPDKAVFFTEISGGRWATNFSDNLMWNLENIFIGTMNNWSETALLWNLALDQNDGPTNSGCSNCRGVVTIDTVSGTVTKNEEYYALAHFSKFVQPGAYRILTQAPAVERLHYVTFVNPDRSIVWIAANTGNTSILLTVRQGTNSFVLSIPAKAVATVVW
jgi:glucosylceramidase